MRKALSVFAVLACCVCLAVVAPAWAQPKVVKIGNIEPLSGSSASVGQQGK